MDANETDAQPRDFGAALPLKTVELATGLASERAEELALMLTSRGVPHVVRAGVHHDGEFAIWVSPRYAARARRELGSYLLENADWPPHDGPELIFTKGVGAGLAGALFLAFVYQFQAFRTFGLDWEAIGRVDGVAVRGGAVERCVTALMLHADVVHVVSNMIFGLPLFAAVCQPFGAGVGMLVALAAGIAGNALSVAMQPPEYLSLGASTAVFGALGALLVQRFLGEHARTRSLRRRALPVALGLGYLALTGTGGERTDVVAHLTGFLAGALLGWVATKLPQSILKSDRVQWTCGALCALALSGAWVIALARARL